MASSVAAVAGSVVAAPAVTAKSLSSSAAFGSSSPVVRLAPAVTKKSGVVAVRASQAPEESTAARREVLTGLFAAGAMLASTPAIAAMGPGGNGAERTAKKATSLLKDADKLTTNDSPPKFGRGGVQGAVQEAGSTATQAGAGATKNVENVADAAVANARNNLNKAKASFADLMGKDKVSDASGVINEAKANTQSAAGDAKSNASDAADNAKGFLSDLGDKITGNSASNVASDVQGKASNAVGGAQNKVDSVTGGNAFEKKQGTRMF